jgi:hypothetical protein
MTTGMALYLAGIDKFCVPHHISEEPLKAGTSRFLSCRKLACRFLLPPLLSARPPSEASYSMAFQNNHYSSFLCWYSQHLYAPLILSSHRVPNTRPCEQPIKGPWAIIFCVFMQKCPAAATPWVRTQPPVSWLLLHCLRIINHKTVRSLPPKIN